jgi:flavin-dependent dehydrogenase
VEAAGFTARYLVAADGLHSPVRRAAGLDPSPSRHPRFGLRRHYRIEPWSDLIEVHWSPRGEAYVTPVAEDLLGVAILGPPHGDFDTRLADFPALRERLKGAEPVGTVRGAGPLRQDVRYRVAGNVLLVGDASGYIDALTGEGIGVALTQAAALVRCLRTGRTEDYERRWRKVTRTSRILTAGLLWARHTPPLATRIVPAAALLPRTFTSLVNHVADA